MDRLIRDLRFAVRGWVRRPGLAAVIVLTVAVATGGCTAIFTLLHGLLFAPLPGVRAEGLFALTMAYPQAGIDGGRLSLPDLVDAGAACTSCVAVGAADDWGQAASSGILAYFAAVAVLLAGLGVYGVVAFSVSRRTREVGVRLAVGAAPEQVVRLFVGEGLVQVAAGVAAGLVGALALSRLLDGLLYGVAARDPRTVAAVSAILLAVGLVATWLPARRAARVDPVASLRAE